MNLELQVIFLYLLQGEVDSNYQSALTKIMILYKDFEKEFYEKNGINKDKVTETINYNCSFDDFYEQLLKIKEKYSLENIFLRKNRRGN